MQRKIDDWVGRNLAEARSASAAFVVRLSYGRNEANDEIHERTVVLTYSDVQKYLKRLRRHGYTVRYFVTGEYGPKNGRAHWHIILYFYGNIPPHKLEDNFYMCPFWDHGYSYWTKADLGSARYVCKYVLKDMDEYGRHAHLAMTKKPPLGGVWFKKWAEEFVQQGLAPQTPEYTFPDVTFKDRDGRTQRKKFWLVRHTRDLFLEHFIATWAAERPSQPLPQSDFVEEYLDKLAEPIVQQYHDERWFAEREKSPEKPKGFLWMDPDQFMRQWVNEAKDDEERQKRQAAREQYEWQQAVDWQNAVEQWDREQGRLPPYIDGETGADKTRKDRQSKSSEQ